MIPVVGICSGFPNATIIRTLDPLWVVFVFVNPHRQISPRATLIANGCI
jgi:hypothetical protein